MPAIQKTNWRSVFTRVGDSDDGQPRFYIRGSRSHLFEYDGYMGTHPKLNEILDFLGGNEKSNWIASDSPMNISTYEYLDYFCDPVEEESNDRIEIYGGNYMFCGNPQGAYIVGFRLLRALVSHFGLSQPRKLKGEVSNKRMESND
jgi:hypothetical protein